MKHAILPLPEIGAIAATRGMLGAGIGLLLSSRIRPRKRRLIGWPLLAIGVLTTVPLVLDVRRRIRRAEVQATPPSDAGVP